MSEKKVCIMPTMAPASGVTEDAPALEPVTAGGAPLLPSIKEFPEEERRLPTHSLTPSRVRCV